MANVEAFWPSLPEDCEGLRALIQTLWQEREQHRQQAAEQQRRVEEQQLLLAEQQGRVEEQSRQTAQLQTEILRLQVELERYKKWYYGPRADRLRTARRVGATTVAICGRAGPKAYHRGRF